MYRPLFSASLSILTVASLAAQNPPAQPQQVPPQAPPVFRAGVDLVRIDVRATDSSGQPVSNLRADEIEILEDGVVRPVLLFQHIGHSGRSYVESAERTIASEISTNQGAPRGQLYVLVVDQQHLSAGMEARVRLAAEAFLRQRVRPEDRVAVYGLPEPGPAQGFTANAQLANAALGRLRADRQRSLSGSVLDMTVHEAYEILRGSETMMLRFIAVSPTGSAAASNRLAAFQDAAARGGDDIAALRAIVRENARQVAAQADSDARRFLVLMADLLRSFRGIDGRKTVVLFSEGFYGDNVAREMEQVAAAAAETYSTIYALDLNRRIELDGAAPGASDLAAEISNRIDPLGSLAAETSGSLLIDAGASLERTLGAIGNVGTEYYLVGFAAPADGRDAAGRYRRIQIRSKRPGVRVTTRSGYATAPAATPGDRRRAIDTALRAPFTQPGLKVEYTTYVGRSERSGLQRVAVSLEAELPVASAPGVADIVFVVRDSRTGGVATSGTDTIPLPSEAQPGSALGRAAWRVAMDLPAGDYIMRCVVREPGGVVGSADRRFTVASLGGPSVAASDLVLASAAGPMAVRALAYNEGQLAGTARLYARAAGQLESIAARVELVPVSGEGSAPSMQVEIGETRQDGGGVMRDAFFSLPLERVPPGEYITRLVVRVQGEVVADLRRQVDVVAGLPPPRPSAAATRDPRLVVRSAIARQLIRGAQQSALPQVKSAATLAENERWNEVLAAAAIDAPEAAWLRGLAEIALGSFTESAATLGAEFDARPTNAGVAFVLGWARVGAGDRPGAISAFRNAVLLEPSMVPAHLALAETYLSLNQPALAVQALEAGLAKIPASPELQTMLAAIRRPSGKGPPDAVP